MAAYEDYFYDFCNFVSEVHKLEFKPDLLKSPTGKNFRAISEKEIIDTINEVLKGYHIDYNILVKENHLEIREVAGQLVFVATCLVRLEFFIEGLRDPIAISEALGQGIDCGDKAVGKAYTYAVKYALLKKFRITYGDDPDATESKPIETAPEEPKEKKPRNTSKGKEKEPEEPLITEKMTSYIVGLVKKLGINDQDFKKKWGYFPSSEKIPMRLAREIIEDLKKQDDGLPF